MALTSPRLEIVEQPKSVSVKVNWNFQVIVCVYFLLILLLLLWEVLYIILCPSVLLRYEYGKLKLDIQICKF